MYFHIDRNIKNIYKYCCFENNILFLMYYNFLPIQPYDVEVGGLSGGISYPSLQMHPPPAVQLPNGPQDFSVHILWSK